MNVDKGQLYLSKWFDSDVKPIEIVKEEIIPEKITQEIKRITNVEAAGIFDGEGCVGVYNNKLRTMLVNTNLEILKNLKQEYGGQIHDQRKGKEHYKDKWVWYIQDRPTIKKFLLKILPYILYKKPQIKHGLTFIQLKDSLNGKSPSQEQYNLMIKIRDELKRLKHTELSTCELNDFNTQIEEMNTDKLQHTMMDY